MIEKSSFPISTYLFWVITPIVMIFFFVICVMMIWSPPDFEKFLARREGKNLIGASIGVVAIFIGVLFIEDTSSLMYTIIQPFRFKLSFFLIYGGCALGISAALAVFVAELKARLLLRNK
jgi:hypothetical protein